MSGSLQLGYVAGAHGVRGALEIKLFNPGSAALAAGVRITLSERGGGDPRSFEVTREAAKPGSDRTRLWLLGVDSREAAEQLRGRELWIARADLPDLAEDEFYLADLIGHEVVRRCADASFESLGEIVGVTSNTAQDLFEVRLRGREWLLPAFAPFIVAIEDQRVIVDVHDELLPEPEDRR
ncbi:MAG TPA: ribosome maturation factor RimM [Enhygromyxa sp.]|nr:ribosome maturation factor RimM [Enhygromyxa sp.]